MSTARSTHARITSPVGHARSITLAAITLLLTFTMAVAQGAQLSESEQRRKELNDRHDIQNLRQKTDFVVDTSERFIQRPDADIAGDFTIARTPPAVKLQILPNMEPEHFSGEEAYQAGWANWAKITRSDDNRFFLSASDHLGRGAQVNLYEYRPDEGVVERVLDVSEALGWHKDMYTDGKLHGKAGIMSDGTMWAATHRGPAVTQAWWDGGYRGSWLFSYNIHTGETVNYGVPLVGNSLPLHTVDTERGIFAGTGAVSHTMLVWDINEKRTRFAGHLPNGWVWHERSMFLDKATGHFWGMDSSQRPYRFLSYDPELNRFKRHDVTVPENPADGNQGILRGHTFEPDADGWYYWMTSAGAFFKFRPNWDEGPEIEMIGTNWDQGRDVLQLALCPERRYIYYQPKGRNSPLVQFDVKTQQKKAIGFLQDYYFDTYGYSMGSQVYGVEVSTDGSFVVIADNGTFEGRNSSFGHPSVIVVSIPEEERPLD